MPLAERLQSLFVALAALTGLATGLLLPIGPTAAHAVLPALILMLTAVFLQMNFARLGEARHATRLVTTSLILNFAVTPALAWTLGAGLLTTHPDLRIGLLLLLVTPCTDWYLVFTALAHGHTGLATALLPVNLLLQLALLPGYVLLLGGNAAMVDATTLTESVLLVLALPLTTALDCAGSQPASKEPTGDTASSPPPPAASSSLCCMPQYSPCSPDRPAPS